MFQIVTDSGCDLPYEVLKVSEVDFLSMTIQLDGKELVDDLGEYFDYHNFINKLKEGAMPTTSQINVGRYLEFFRPYLEKDIPVLYIGFSSGLSGSFQSANQAVQILKEEGVTTDIYVFDTLGASLGSGLLVLEAARLRDEGKTMSETIEWLEDHKLNVQSWVTVDDLKHLERGGRISKTAAAMGSLLSVKPIINVDRDGKLQNVDKVRGRNKSIQKIVAETVKQIVAPENQTIYIAYAGDEAAAIKSKQLLEQAIRVKDVKIYPLGPTISSHTGYGCVAIFSMGIKR